MISTCDPYYVLAMDNRLDDVRGMTVAHPPEKEQSAETSGRKEDKKMPKKGKAKVKKGK